MNKNIELTIHIAEDFKALKSKLLPLQFRLNREGALLWTNPFEKTQQFTIKPLREGSTNYSVKLSRYCEQVISMLTRCLSFFDCDVRQLHYILTPTQANFNRENFRQIAKREWSECSPYIFMCLNRKDAEVVCIIMQDNVFHTRSVHSLNRIQHFVELCDRYSSFFVQETPFNLFTFEEYAVGAVLGGQSRGRTVLRTGS
ncbi:hypothetical protein PVA17_19235 [Lysinibacillus sp. CNPSo 3705]|uniref:hypothetical protein n=1 Tax=Lysinibacillus sp. CNPSo 3705 TaxID=3028148 RepID=UPI002363E512|nr:hypothetical protein [Lysinibacillus sp. CNPSo 3705]MDD1504876.1 hypothetical protein [Lysinibacillus sp. CNPSo 3705]